MSEKTPRLPDKYLDVAKKIIKENRSKSNCKACYDRGFIGTNQDNMIVPCTKCVDVEEVMVKWRSFVRENEELTNLYGEYFEAVSYTHLRAHETREERLFGGGG